MRILCVACQTLSLELFCGKDCEDAWMNIHLDIEEEKNV
jgi:hypothetical protein